MAESTTELMASMSLESSDAFTFNNFGLKPSKDDSEENTITMMPADPHFHTTFHPFKRLAQEIRDEIWQIAIDNIEPRIVEIKGPWNKSHGKLYKSRAMTSTCPIPSLLHASPDSRKLALIRWKLSFPKQHDYGRYKPKIFFDHLTDTLWFGRDAYLDDFFWFIKARDRREIRRIALNMHTQILHDKPEKRRNVPAAAVVNSGDLGNDLAFALGENLPLLEELVFIGHEAGMPADNSPPSATSTSLTPAPPAQANRVGSFRTFGDGLGTGILIPVFKHIYKDLGLKCPEVRVVEYQRLFPHSEAVSVLVDQL